MDAIDMNGGGAAGMDLESGRKAEWREAMLAESSAVLQALARNYLGGNKTWPSKASIVSGLASMVADPEIQSAAMAMMDRLDRLIVGMLSLTGEAAKDFLQQALAGEVSYHELDYKLANLGERLLIYKTKGGNFAVNPHFAAAARAGVARADVLFGPDPDAAFVAETSMGAPQQTQGFDLSGQPPAPRPLQDLALIAYALLKEGHDILLKNGQLSARARKRVSGLIPSDPEGVEIVEALFHALLAAKFISRDEHGLLADFKSLSEFLVSGGGDFAFAIACAASGGLDHEERNAIARGLTPLFANGFAFSPPGFSRFMRLFPFCDRGSDFPGAFALVLENLGLLENRDGTLICSSERVSIRWYAKSENLPGSISVDGTGTIHILPSASLQNLIALLDIGVLISASGAWKLAITRESARRAFASGRSVEDVERLLAGMSGMPVPQTLAFDLRDWESEYNSVRLFRGYVLSADRNAAKIIDQSSALSRFPHEMLGEGLYYFGNVQAATIEKVLLDIGLPPPALRNTAKTNPGKAHRAPPLPPIEALRDDTRRDDAMSGAVPGNESHNVASDLLSEMYSDGKAVFPDKVLVSPEMSLEKEIARLTISTELRKKMEERLKRKLIYTMEQLHAMVESEGAASGTKGYREIGFAASGLDFNGKLRVIQSSLKAKFSRLDIRWTADGEMKSGSVRPVSLRKTERDYILEGEDVSNGGPISIRVGSMMQVNLHKGFLLGDE